jgi:hypothetical protein
MRALSTCLSVILGVSVCYLAACSSDSDAGGGGGAAGEAGESSSAGSSGKAGSGNTAGANSSGAAGVAGDTGAAGAAGAPAGCAFESSACTSCLTKKCSAEVGACATAADCGGALDGLDACACGGEKTALMCETAFIADGGNTAQPLVDCFNQNCASVCAM